MAGMLAIHFMLGFLRRQPPTLFVVYRVLAAAAVFVIMLSPHGA
jgi:undecaprenyl pyrophosphate phosphatase UppP